MYQLSDLPSGTDKRVAFFEQIMQDKNIPLSEKLKVLANFARVSEQASGSVAGAKYWGLNCDITDALYFWSERARI